MINRFFSVLRLLFKRHVPQPMVCPWRPLNAAKSSKHVIRGDCPMCMAEGDAYANTAKGFAYCFACHQTGRLS
jgi:hypothetical protein